MNRESKFRLVILGGIAVVALIIFEIFVYNNREVVDEKTEEAKKQVEIMKSTTVYNEQEAIYNYINEVVELMNKKDFKTLYGMLKEDYKSYLFSDYAQFESYMEKYAYAQFTPKYSSYYRDGNKYIVIIDYLQKEYNRNDLVNGVGNKYDIVTIEKDKKGEFRFALGNFIESEQNNKSAKKDDLEFTILRTTRYAETTEVKILVTNKSNENIYFENNNIRVNSTGGKAAVLSSLPLTVIKPDATLVVNLEVSTKYNSHKNFTGCIFTGVKSESGKIYEDITVNI